MLSITRVAFVITTCCTLKCTHCVHLNSRYETRQNFELSDLISDVDHLLHAVDRIESIHVMGGEALISPFLADIIGELLEREKIGHVGLTTNGTILPEEPLLSVLRHPKAEVYISNYKDISRTDEWSERLDKAGVSYHTPEPQKDWIEAGGIEPRGRSVDQLREMLSKCLYRECTTLLNGKVYTCPRNANAVNQGIIPFNESGGVNLRNQPAAAIREKIDWMLNTMDHIVCCDRCDYILPDGFQKHINRAEQAT